MLVKYSFDIASLPNHMVDSDILAATIKTSNISKALDCVNTSDGMCDVWFQDTLSGSDVVILNSVMANHSGSPTIQAVIGDKIQKAMDFGKKIMIEYGTKNVMRGYNVEQTRAVSIRLTELQSLLLSGSLYCARQSAIDMTPDTLVTQADKDELIAKLNYYLGIPS